MPSFNQSDLTQLPHLSPEQQSLLLAALSSNRRNIKASAPSAIGGSQQLNNVPTITPALNLTSNSPSQPHNAPASSSNSYVSTFGDSFFPDYDESNTIFDVDFPLKEDDHQSEFPGFGHEENEPSEKRKIPDDDEEEEENDSKRREGDDKVAKKPGRKLITAEPTTKRKAQNRAAQRAFRERKEKHVKDLEQKVFELEKATDNTSQENGLLRAQIDRLQSELQDYKKRLSLTNNGIGGSPPRKVMSLSSAPLNTWDGMMSDFQFDFSKFGDSSGNDFSNGNSTSALSDGTSVPSSTESGSDRSSQNSLATRSTSSIDSMLGSGTTFSGRTDNDFSWLVAGNADTSSTNSGDLLSNDDHGLLVLQSSVDQSSGEPRPGKNDGQNSQQQQSRSTSYTSNLNSPTTSSSSTGLTGSMSSCPTSPEPLPGHVSEPSQSVVTNKPETFGILDGQLTSSTTTLTAYDSSNIDWLAQQNGGQFDPVLFSDYRESQDAIVGDGDFSSGFFGDPYSFGDFNTNTFDFAIDTTVNPIALSSKSTTTVPISDGAIPAQPTQKSASANLMDRVERCRNGDTGHEPAVYPTTEMLTTHVLWSELKDCPYFLSGDFDIDILCRELSAKATCSETGISVPKEVVEKVLWCLAGVPDGGDRAAAESVREDLEASLQTSKGGQRTSMSA